MRGTLSGNVLPNPAQFGSALSELLTGGDRRERPDFRQSFYLALAKVLGAAAWIDAPINQAEINVVKSLLNELSPRLTSRELRRVQRYLTEPVPRAHWDELLLALSEFTRRRARLQFALDRLRTLLAADGERRPAEEQRFRQAQTVLDWRRLQQDTPPAAEPDPPQPSGVGIRLGELAPEAAGDDPGAVVDRVRAAASARLGGKADRELPWRLAVWAATLVQVTVRRARTDGEDAELVGFLAAVTGVDDAAADAALEAARELRERLGAPAAEELADLAAALRDTAGAVEVASLAKLLNSMAGGDAALRRLRQLAAGI